MYVRSAPNNVLYTYCYTRHIILTCKHCNSPWVWSLQWWSKQKPGFTTCVTAVTNRSYSFIFIIWTLQTIDLPPWYILIVWSATWNPYHNCLYTDIYICIIHTTPYNMFDMPQSNGMAGVPHKVQARILIDRVGSTECAFPWSLPGTLRCHRCLSLAVLDPDGPLFGALWSVHQGSW